MNAERIILNLAQIINRIVPKKDNQIFFYSSPDYSDNARILFEKICESGNKNNYSFVWAVNDYKKYKNRIKRATVVKHRTLRNLWHYCRSRYIIRTHSLWGNRYVHGKQIMCVAWHGMHFKGYTQKDLRKPGDVYFDHFCVTAPIFAPMYSHIFSVPVENFDVTGLPRDDYLFDENNEIIDVLNLGRFKKRIIWMPTYRSTNMARATEGKETEFGIPLLRREDLSILNEKLKQLNYCLILKLHHWASESIGELDYSNIIEIKDKDIPEPYSLYHLIAKMDAMLSDYSSVWGDFLLLNRPIGFAFDDLEEYKKSRTMELDPIEDYMPGMRIKNTEDLFVFFDSLELEDKYIEERKRIADIFLAYQDGNSSIRFLNAIGLKGFENEKI